MKSNLILHQLFEKESSTYTYLIYDPSSKDAVLIDPVIEMTERDLKLIRELGLSLKYIFETHVHADHITGSGEIRKRTGAKIGISSAYDMSCADLHLDDNQTVTFGEHSIRAIHTPGHTSGCTSYHLGDWVFTGDALLIRGCGRTDFQEGSAETLFHSVREKLFKLPEDTIIYPAHDYKGFSQSSIGEEKQFNPRLRLENSKEDFIQIMKELKLAQPKKIVESVPANLLCGLPAPFPEIASSNEGGVQVLSAEEAHKRMGQFRLIDVRGDDEFNNELGHIPGARLKTLGESLSQFLDAAPKDDQFLFVCRSGKRSLEATKLAKARGIEQSYNLEGGMIRWNELHYPVERDRGGS